MPNNRVFYASHGVKVDGIVVQGAQSVGVTTNFNLEQAFQLGQLAIYDNMVVDPEVEITINKALDGENTIWNLATGGGSLIDKANEKSTIIVGVGSDTSPTLSSTAAIQCTGMFISSLTYTFPVDGNFTEDVTFVGNNKTIEGSVSAPSASGNTVLRRQHFDLGNSTLPSEVAGKNLSNITISADLGRESMYKLGKYAPFHRFVNFPLEVTCEFEVIATTIDNVKCDLTEVSCDNPADLPSEQQITIAICQGSGNDHSYTFNLGNKNTLQSVNYSGGDTGGGNVTITYSYTTYNDLTITG